MRIRLSLAAIAACLLSAQAVGQPPKATSQKLNAILCKTEDQAIAIAQSMAAGTTEPIAIDDVNKAARAEVCGHISALPLWRSRRQRTTKANLFMLAGFRFVRAEHWSGPRAGSRLSTALRFRGEPRRRQTRPASPATNWLTRPCGDQIRTSRDVLMSLPKAAAHCKLALNLSKSYPAVAAMLPKVCRVLPHCSIALTSFGIP